MEDLYIRLKQSCTSRRGQLIILSVLAALTVLLVGAQAPWGTPALFGRPRAPGTAGTITTPTEVTVDVELSQTKFVQGQEGIVYANLSIRTPAGSAQDVGRTPTDIVVALDRSPSMLAANKLPFAKVAVLELLNQLNASDRLGLVAFDGQAVVYSELVEVDQAARQHLTHLITTMNVGSATNIGDGLLRARELVANSPSARVKKIILLSDGETNRGITNPQALAKLASDISANHIVLSTIGMGLGFNEALMASLADHGMGHYAYLEHVQGLGKILAQDLENTRRTYAAGSELRLHLQPDVQLLDAAGYPVEPSPGPNTPTRIKIGQLLWGAGKHLTLTLKVPTTATGHLSLGSMVFHLNSHGVDGQMPIKSTQLAFAVVTPEKAPEALASIRSEVYKHSWLSNNLGRMRQELHHWIKTGNKPKAEGTIATYRQQLKEAEAQSGMVMRNEKLDADIAEMETRLDDAFQGSADEQAQKRNRASKRLQYLGREEQRN